MVDLPSSPLAVVDPEFERMALETGEFTYGLSSTSVREKLFQVIANDVCRGHVGLAFRMHLMAAKMHGIPYPDLLALLRFVAPYAGYPATADALERLGAVGAEVGFDTSAGLEPGHGPGRDAWNDRADAALVSDDGWMREFVVSRTGRSWCEERLTPRERAIVAITTDVSMYVLGDSFRGHVQAALRIGLTPDEVREVVRFTAEFCSARTVDALAELERVLS
jgi:alkylhydroperoxidase/carboxymuconolactone decarboxylase family protein YurZ